MSDYQHDGAETIKLSHDNDEITVWPSVEAPGSVTIALLDSEEPRTNIGIASPPECDALIAAIGRALGRPAPTSTPLEERIAASLRGAQQAKPFATDQGRAQGIVEVWERALAMVREQGALSDRDLSQLRALVGQSPDDTFDQCIREIEALIARLKTEREMGAQWERDEIENMIGADTSPGILAVTDRLIAMVRARSGEAAREQGATVPRAGVAAVRERFDKWIREEGGKQNEYVEGMTVGIKDAILALDALLAASTTQPEKG